MFSFIRDNFNYIVHSAAFLGCAVAAYTKPKAGLCLSGVYATITLVQFIWNRFQKPPSEDQASAPAEPPSEPSSPPSEPSSPPSEPQVHPARPSVPANSTKPSNEIEDERDALQYLEETGYKFLHVPEATPNLHSIVMDESPKQRQAVDFYKRRVFIAPSSPISSSRPPPQSLYDYTREVLDADDFYADYDDRGDLRSQQLLFDAEFAKQLQEEEKAKKKADKETVEVDSALAISLQADELRTAQQITEEQEKLQADEEDFSQAPPPQNVAPSWPLTVISKARSFWKENVNDDNTLPITAETSNPYKKKCMISQEQIPNGHLIRIEKTSYDVFQLVLSLIQKDQLEDCYRQKLSNENIKTICNILSIQNIQDFIDLWEKIDEEAYQLSVEELQNDTDPVEGDPSKRVRAIARHKTFLTLLAFAPRYVREGFNSLFIPLREELEGLLKRQ